MQVPTPVGLVPMDPADVNRRHTIVNVHTNSTDAEGAAMINTLQDTWIAQGMSVSGVIEKLNKPDVEVGTQKTAYI